MKNKKEVVYKIEAYPKSRIVNKIIKGLKETGNFKIAKSEGDLNSRIFDVLILNEQDYNWFSFVSEICHIIKKQFPDNYQFNFREKKLGYTYSFNITTDTGQVINCYSRKKEIRTDGTSTAADPNDQIIL